MKLTRRDKVLLISVLVILILVLGGLFVAKPKYEVIQDKKIELQEIQKKQEETKAKMGTLEPLKEQLRGIVAEIDTIQEYYLDEMTTYETDMYISNLIDNLRVGSSKFEFTIPAVEQVNPYVIYKQNITAYDLKMNSYYNEEIPKEVIDAYNGNEQIFPTGIPVSITKYTITFGNDLMNALKIADKIEQDEKSLYVYSATSKNEDEDATVVIYLINTKKIDTQAILDNIK